MWCESLKEVAEIRKKRNREVNIGATQTEIELLKKEIIRDLND